jgi:hypothetical protein
LQEFWKLYYNKYTNSINFKNIQQTTLNEPDVDAQQTFNDEEITSSTSFFCFSIKKILTQEKTTILKSIMHLKTNNYSMNEIIDKQTLSQNSERNMSSSSRQRSVSVVQMISRQTSNAFDVLRNRSSIWASQKTTQNTQTQTSFQSQTVFKSRKRLLNSRKTIENRQNDDELWRHISFLHFYSTMWKMKRKIW